MDTQYGKGLVLPRFMNRGLIEAARMYRITTRTSVLPRFMNRGLIEARRPTPGPRPRTPLPRFMNRGLIEAYCADVTMAKWQYFPDS